MNEFAPDPTAPVGMVLGTEDATPLQFWFAVRNGAKVQLDDLVVVEVADPAAGEGEPHDPIRFFGVVDEVRRRFEGVQFDGDTELVAEGLMPANVAYAAHVLVTRVDPEEFVPPAPGDPVRFATGETLEKALYLDAMDAPLPAGVLRNGEPGFLNLDFVNGSKGAHINISGISGIATKTSYALFLLYSIFKARSKDGRGPLVKNPHATKAVVFNVKGQDLFFLDKRNKQYAAEEGKWSRKNRASRGRYEICGLSEGAFDSCEVHAPAREGGSALVADADVRDDTSPYVWTLQEFCAERMLPFVLADGDAMSNLGFLVAHVVERLAKLAEGQRTPYLAVEPYRHLVDPDVAPGGLAAIDEDDGDPGFLEPERAPELRGDRERVATFDELVDFLEAKLLLEGADEEGTSGGDRRWTANQAKATREALVRRLRGASKHVRRLVRGDLPAKALARGRLDVLGSSTQVHVVDIHQLAPLAQMFVVGVLLRGIFERREGGRPRGEVYVVLDELNKYAPAEGASPIKEVLLDIAERGRSLGVILIGAQQTASEVERRVVGNAAVRVVGRLDAAEAERSEYRFMPSSFRGRATILAPGTMIVHQPDVPTPMMLTFPFPSWATRAKEVEEVVTDDEAADILG